ncbi:MAG: DUF5660 family protein [Weeksellaceae bacterium]
MAFHGLSSHKKSMKQHVSDSIETEKAQSIGDTFSSLGKDTAKKIGDGFADIGKGIFDQLLGTSSSEQQYNSRETQGMGKQPEQDPKQFRTEGGNVFSFRRIEEDRQMNEIKELIQAIKQEVEMIKKADSSLMGEVSDIEKLTINNMPDKPGIYHVRFLEIVLKVLQGLRAKIGESNTWMQALQSKKKARGSAFAANSKKKGTQYSMSEELKATRAVQ